MKYIAFLFLCFIAACSSNKNTTKTDTAQAEVTDTSTDKTLLLTVKRGACYGTCPIYDISIYSNGDMEYNGIRFVEMLGPHKLSLKADQLKQLNNTMGAIDWKSYPDKIPSMIADLPGSTLINHSLNPEKSIWWNTDAPSELTDLRDLVGTYITNPTWEVDKKAEIPAYAKADELLIKFKENVDVNAFTKGFEKYGLTIKEQLIPNMPIWLFTYDDSQIAPYEMLNKINKSNQVDTAEFNKKVNTRR